MTGAEVTGAEVTEVLSAQHRMFHDASVSSVQICEVAVIFEARPGIRMC